MKCPLCGGYLLVTDSRCIEGNMTRRRKECVDCSNRFTTIEQIQTDSVKRGIRKKIKRGIRKKIKKSATFEKCEGCKFDSECSKEDRIEGRKIHFSCHCK